MNKMIVIIMILALAFSTCAFAAEIQPATDVNMEENFGDRILHVGFKPDALTEDKLVADIYEQQIYDIVDVNQLAVGDTITYLGEEVTVEAIADTEVGKEINGGVEEGGITLLTEDDANGFIAYGMDNPVYLMLGCAEFTFADEVTVHHWIQNEDGSVDPEALTTDTIAGNEVKDFFAEDNAEIFVPAQVRIHVVDYVIDEIFIDYIP